MNELQVFNNPEFGEMRTFTEPDGAVLYCLTDAARELGYANPPFAVKKYCPNRSKRSVGVKTGKKSNGKDAIRNMNLLFGPPGDVYRLMHRAAEQSQSSEIKERAEKFGSWIFDDILPKIAQTGAYITDKADPVALRQKADELESMATINETAKMLLPIFSEAGMKPAFQALAMRQIYRKAGVELPLNDLKADRELYDLRAIARRVGLYAESGKPHERAVGAIIRNLNVPDSEKELVNFEKQGHMGTTYQYTVAVVDMIQEWLVQNNCPLEIQGTKAGKLITYRVKYTTGGANHV